MLIAGFIAGCGSTPEKEGPGLITSGPVEYPEPEVRLGPDGVIFVIESEKVRREVVLNAKEKLEKSGANIFGVVLNKRRLYIPRWVYKRI